MCSSVHKIANHDTARKICFNFSETTVFTVQTVLCCTLNIFKFKTPINLSVTVQRLKAFL